MQAYIMMTPEMGWIPGHLLNVAAGSTVDSLN